MAAYHPFRGLCAALSEEAEMMATDSDKKIVLGWLARSTIASTVIDLAQALNDSDATEFGGYVVVDGQRYECRCITQDGTPDFDGAASFNLSRLLSLLRSATRTLRASVKEDTTSDTP